MLLCTPTTGHRKWVPVPHSRAKADFSFSYRKQEKVSVQGRGHGGSSGQARDDDVLWRCAGRNSSRVMVFLGFAEVYRT